MRLQNSNEQIALNSILIWTEQDQVQFYSTNSIWINSSAPHSTKIVQRTPIASFPIRHPMIQTQNRHTMNDKMSFQINVFVSYDYCSISEWKRMNSKVSSVRRKRSDRNRLCSLIRCRLAFRSWVNASNVKPVSMGYVTTKMLHRVAFKTNMCCIEVVSSAGFFDSNGILWWSHFKRTKHICIGNRQYFSSESK